MNIILQNGEAGTNRKVEDYNDEMFIFTHLEIVLKLTSDDKQNSIIDMIYRRS